jgi:glycosyltransferase involved in cell wall biosynthesis
MVSVCMLLQGHYETDIRVRRKAEALTLAGYRVDVLALRSSFSKSESYTVNNVNVHTLSLGKQRRSLVRYLYEYLAFFVWVVLKLPGLMRRRRYAVIDVNTLPDFLVFATLLARWKGAKVILDMHEITPEFYISKYKVTQGCWIIRMLKFVEKISMRYADHVITINEPIQKLLESRGLLQSKSTIIMNSADDQLFALSTDTAPPPNQEVKKEAFIMMYHGTLTSIYGLDIAIEAFSIARNRISGAELWILGAGPERDALERLTRRLKLDACVKFIGTVLPQEVHRWLRQCDIGVLATRQDIFLDYSFSNKLSEYIIMDKAVIVSRLRAIHSYFSDDALKFFEPGNATELAECMVTLFNDPALRIQLARKAKEELQPIRWEVMRERYLDLVEELIETGDGRSGVLNVDS